MQENAITIVDVPVEAYKNQCCSACLPPPPPSPTTPHPYQAVVRLGEGVFGKVMKAIATETNELVAIKKCRQQYAKSSIAEAQVLKELTTGATGAAGHENVITFIECALSKRHVYIFADGGDLAQMLSASKRPFNDKQVFAFAQQIISGLIFVHTSGIVHCDLKPENLVLCGGVLKLADFGNARRLKLGEPPICERGLLAKKNAGTPLYIAPEVLSGNGYDHRRDIYSAGIILFEMCRGARVFTFKPSEISEANRFYDVINVCLSDYESRFFADELLNFLLQCYTSVKRRNFLPKAIASTSRRFTGVFRELDEHGCSPRNAGGEKPSRCTLN